MSSAIDTTRVHEIGDDTEATASELRTASGGLSGSAGNSQFAFSAKVELALAHCAANLTTLADTTDGIGSGLHDTATAYERTEAFNRELAAQLGRTLV